MVSGRRLRFLAPWWLAAAGIGWVAACSRHAASPPVPTTPCGFDVWYKPASPRARVEIVGSWQGFRRPGVTLPAERPDGWRFLHVDVGPGEYRYVVVDDGTELANPNVGTTAEVDGREMTWVDVTSCSAPTLVVDSSVGAADGSVSVRARFRAANGGTAVDPRSVALVSKDGNTRIGPVETRDADGTLTFRVEGLPKGKHVFDLHAADTRGLAAAPVRVSAWISSEPFALDDAILYQVIVDRFATEGGAPESPELASGRAGGTLRGVTRAIERGQFASLGVNTLWLSPLYKNPAGLFPDGDGNVYSSYHGYWPIASRELESSLGTEADFDALVRTAHADGLRVIVDVVPNHVHAGHPRWKDRTSDRGFNRPDGSCICGTPTCPWAGNIRECWFAPYMPDLDWNDADVARTGVDDVAWWIDRFDTDGVRVDAVPMMPRAATRRIATALRTRFEHDGNPLLLLGENFTGPGGFDLLRYQLGPFGLDSQFDFPLMWALRGAVAEGTLPMSAIADTVLEGERAWAGSGAVMATMIGNHDVTRFLSVADGTADGNGFVPAPSPTARRTFDKQRLALAAVFTLPGAPVLYYGDEFGMPGRRDPDSRRVMKDEADLDALQAETLAFTRRLGSLRARCPVLRRGRYRLLHADREAWVFVRESEGKDTALVLLGRTPQDRVAVPADAMASLFRANGTSEKSDTPVDEAWTEALSGRTSTLRPELTKFDVGPFSAQIWLPSHATCLGAP